MKKITWTLNLERETKGTFLYRDPDNRKHTQYVPKDEIGKTPPDEITVTITTKE